MATMLLFSNAVSDTYKTTSDAIKEVKLNDKLVIRKTLTDLMKTIFFLCLLNIISPRSVLHQLCLEC